VTESAASTAWYLYAFAGPRPAVDDLRGVGPGELTVIGDESVAAVAGMVPLEEFGQEALPARLNDRAWLEEKAQAHERVVEQLAETTAVIPLRFGSIYYDVSAVEQLVESRRAELLQLLERVRGRVEIGVQAWLDPRRAVEANPDTPPAGGRAYLERRRDERARADEAAIRMQEVLADAHERLAALAVEGVLNRPQPRELTGRVEEMVFNGAYLVPSNDDSIAREVAQLDEQNRALGLSFDVTGPWPPYNFVDPEAGG
jgi:hypothetical protein